MPNKYDEARRAFQVRSMLERNVSFVDLGSRHHSSPTNGHRPIAANQRPDRLSSSHIPFRARQGLQNFGDFGYLAWNSFTNLTVSRLTASEPLHALCAIQRHHMSVLSPVSHVAGKSWAFWLQHLPVMDEGSTSGAVDVRPQLS
jgi:hypothetical protein